LEEIDVSTWKIVDFEVDKHMEGLKENQVGVIFTFIDTSKSEDKKELVWFAMNMNIEAELFFGILANNEIKCILRDKHIKGE
jgi:hypothetical protein